jgi:dihydrofolate synthase/folylpolyglutamate synthase
MNYQEVLDFLFSQLPMYQRVGPPAFKKDLGNIKKLCEDSGHPERKFDSIHIAGTNGKGSVAHMLASILQEAGYKVGLYTSPHLKSYRERIRINGKKISKEYVTDYINKRVTLYNEIKPSFFEMSVAMAFDYFADESVDFAVVETGLGGRLDSTNIIRPLLSVITNIGYDHMQFLGDTLEQIAYEKAGIIKQNVPVVIGQAQSQTRSVFLENADLKNAPLYFADYLYSADYSFMSTEYKQILNVYKGGELYYENLHSDLIGIYQRKNIITVLQVVDILQKAYTISREAIYAGLADVRANTGFAGRWHILGFNPLCIADTAHNIDGLKEVFEQIGMTPYKKLHIVLGTVNDKSLDKILRLFPSEAEYYFTQAKVPRALPADQLYAAAQSAGLSGKIFSEVEKAYNEARKSAQSNDLIFVGGSTFIVAEVLDLN